MEQPLPMFKYFSACLPIGYTKATYCRVIRCLQITTAEETEIGFCGLLNFDQL